MPAGRPTTFTPELAAKVLDRMAEGETVASIVKDAAMPSRTGPKYARARVNIVATLFILG